MPEAAWMEPLGRADRTWAQWPPARCLSLSALAFPTSQLPLKGMDSVTVTTVLSQEPGWQDPCLSLPVAQNRHFGSSLLWGWAPSPAYLWTQLNQAIWKRVASRTAGTTEPQSLRLERTQEPEASLSCGEADRRPQDACSVSVLSSAGRLGAAGRLGRCEAWRVQMVMCPVSKT